MSADWGPLMGDPAFRDIKAGPSPAPDRERDTEAGAWPEEMDIGYYADSSMTLPGMGEPGKRCGEWFPHEFCDECGEPQLGVSRCEQRQCPHCSVAWSRRRAEKITVRLGAARHVAEKPLEKRAVHAVMSPPEGSVRTLTDVSQGFRDAYRLAEEKGVRGGVAIFHGYRVTDQTKQEFSEAQRLGKWDESRDGKLWAFVRNRSKRLERGLTPSDWRDLTYWSPHWHILGLCEDFEDDDPDAQGGWVARRIRSLSPFKLHDTDGYSDMVGAARYLLSHGTFESDTSKDCVRWFGELATTQFSPESELSEGALAVIERKAREVAGSDDRGDGEEEEPECECCGSRSFSPIWEAGGALMDPGWCQRIGREQEARLVAAFEWAIGERQPPPGLKRPKTEAEARESLEALL